MIKCSHRAGDLVWINCILFLHPCPLPPLPHSILVSTAGSWPKTSNFCRHQGLGGKIKCQANDHFVKTCHLLRGTDTKMKVHQITLRGCTYIVKKMLKTLIFLFNRFKKLCYITLNNKSITMNTLISIGCIITDQLYSPLWPHETTKI